VNRFVEEDEEQKGMGIMGGDPSNRWWKSFSAIELLVQREKRDSEKHGGKRGERRCG